MSEDPATRPVPTAALIERITQLQASMHEQGLKRHELNNRLMSWINLQEQHFDESAGHITRAATQIRTLHEQISILDKQVSNLQKQVTELDHILRGVDGNDGMRADLAAIRKEQNDAAARQRFLELRIAGVVSVLIGAGFGALKLIGIQ